ncbi:MAG: glutathione S-transferase [Kiritimatiellia bacterium]
MVILYAIPYSPWSEKARWSLDYSGVSYQERAYQSVLGALPMRARTGRWTERISIPLAIADKVVLPNSYAIARYVAGDNAQFMPTDQAETIESWNRSSERIMAAGRRSTTLRVMRDAPAIKEAITSAMPAGHLMPAAVGRLTARWLLRKYASDTDHDDDLGTMRTELLALRDALDGRQHLLEGFTYADVVMACALQFVQPPDYMRPHLTPLVGAHWRNSELAEAFGDLLSWRDRIVEGFRGV